MVLMVVSLNLLVHGAHWLMSHPHTPQKHGNRFLEAKRHPFRVNKKTDIQTKDAGRIFQVQDDLLFASDPPPSRSKWRIMEIPYKKYNSPGGDRPLLGGGGVDRGYYSLLQHVFQANFPMEHIPFFWVYCGWPLVMGMFFFLLNSDRSHGCCCIP